MTDRKAIGKKNRKKGQLFESKVRAHLEAQGWIVCKWSNQVEDNQLTPAKHKFNVFRRAMTLGTGFPDFIAYSYIKPTTNGDVITIATIIGVEAKFNGYLNPEERRKCDWLLAHNIFSKILIAYNDQGSIEYKDYLHKAGDISSRGRL